MDGTGWDWHNLTSLSQHMVRHELSQPIITGVAFLIGTQNNQKTTKKGWFVFYAWQTPLRQLCWLHLCCFDLNLVYAFFFPPRIVYVLAFSLRERYHKSCTTHCSRSLEILANSALYFTQHFTLFSPCIFSFSISISFLVFCFVFYIYFHLCSDVHHCGTNEGISYHIIS